MLEVEFAQRNVILYAYVMIDGKSVYNESQDF